MMVRIAPSAMTIAILQALGQAIFCREQGIAKTIPCTHQGITKSEDVRMDWHSNGKWIFIGTVS
jgi:hypothetical protein